MEQNTVPETNPPETPPSLGEAMSKLLKSMDPQGLLNMADQEDGAGDNGHDITKSGDAHAGAHAVSLSHDDRRMETLSRKCRQVDSRSS
jgi:hypothetical protein